MKDYSKVKFVKPSVSSKTKTFLKDKVYPFSFVDNCGGLVTNERGTECFIFIPESSHINDQYFIPCDENGKELSDE